MTLSSPTFPRFHHSRTLRLLGLPLASFAFLGCTLFLTSLHPSFYSPSSSPHLFHASLTPLFLQLTLHHAIESSCLRPPGCRSQVLILTAVVSREDIRTQQKQGLRPFKETHHRKPNHKEKLVQTCELVERVSDRWHPSAWLHPGLLDSAVLADCRVGYSVLLHDRVGYYSR